MKAILREIYSLELEDQFEHYWPDDVAHFGTWIRLMIGPENEQGTESFDILVCTTTWLAEQCAAKKCVWGQHMLIVFEYDLQCIQAEIRRYVSSCTGKDWMSIVQKLRYMGAWGFENYEKAGSE